MGEEGFSSRLLAALPPQHPLDDRRVPRVADRRPVDDAQPPAAAAPPPAARPVRRQGRQGRPTSSPDGGWCSATATCASRMPWPARRARGTATGSATSASTSSAAGPGSRRCSARSTSAEGDYVIIPRATTHRWVPKRSTKDPLRTYCIEANSHIAPPKRYLSQVRPAARARPVLRARPAPAGRARCSPRTWARGPATETEVFIKHRGGGPRAAASSARCTRCPSTRSTSSAGTAACTRTCSTSRDFEPITGRVHQPPPVHQVFEGWNFVICNFVPRKVDYHPLSIPVPYYHSNVDSDEIMFYVDGDYEARKGSGIGQRLDLGAPRRSRPRPAARRGRGLHRHALLRRARPSWSTPSARSSSARPDAPSTTGSTPGRGAGAGAPTPAAATTPSADSHAHHPTAPHRLIRTLIIRRLHIG